QRVVAEVEAEAPGANGRRGLLGLLVAYALDVLDRLALLLPELARLAALPVGQRDDQGVATLRGRDRDGACRTPDEVGGVRADDQQPARHQSSPTRRFEFSTTMW